MRCVAPTRGISHNARVAINSCPTRHATVGVAADATARRPEQSGGPWPTAPCQRASTKLPARPRNGAYGSKNSSTSSTVARRPSPARAAHQLDVGEVARGQGVGLATAVEAEALDRPGPDLGDPPAGGRRRSDSRGRRGRRRPRARSGSSRAPARARGRRPRAPPGPRPAIAPRTERPAADQGQAGRARPAAGAMRRTAAFAPQRSTIRRWISAAREASISCSVIAQASASHGSRAAPWPSQGRWRMIAPSSGSPRKVRAKLAEVVVDAEREAHPLDRELDRLPRRRRLGVGGAGPQDDPGRGGCQAWTTTLPPGVASRRLTTTLAPADDAVAAEPRPAGGRASAGAPRPRAGRAPPRPAATRLLVQQVDVDEERTAGHHAHRALVAPRRRRWPLCAPPAGRARARPRWRPRRPKPPAAAIGSGARPRPSRRDELDVVRIGIAGSGRRSAPRRRPPRPALDRFGLEQLVHPAASYSPDLRQAELCPSARS